MAISILGAGLSGLSSAINLAKEGREVVVFERKNDVGQHIRPNYQGLLRTKADPMGYLKSLNLEPKFDLFRMDRALICTRTRDIDVTLVEPVDFVLRGGESSLEYGLYKQARSMGVKFRFNENRDSSKVDIVATGHFRCDMLAYGCVYDDLDFPKDKFLYMHDDRYSPKGWYLYITPLPDGTFKIVNCTSQPHVKMTKRLYYKAINERKIIRDIVGDRKPKETFGGFGGCDFPKSAVKGRTLYVGEAAGFQDPFRGFGMNYALESGFLAAKAILENGDYDRLWKKHFKRRIKTDLYRRYAMVVFGDRAIEHVFRNTNNGDEIDWGRVNPSGIKGKILREVFFRLEKFRRWRTGFW
ncbi:MAG: NAD(P)/FAD-dependent oxidoreductase [Methanomassiliicoccales archaeon]|nr:MAG: NAD(P)/FAD-dependent oxidoreductase [Methanomassiliicoccales archaeon]